MNNELTRALAILYDMEMNNYYMTRSIEKMDEEIQKLGISANIAAPQKMYSSTSDNNIGCVTLGSLLVSVVISIIGGCKFDSFWVGLLIFIATWFVSAILALFLMDAKEDREAERVYEKEYDVFAEKLRIDNIRLEQENKEKTFLIQQRNLLVKRKAEATEKLNEFYSELNIAEEFRNLLPIGYMYEFARLGISTKLEGIDGLYYLVHKELRADYFQLSLNEISKKFDSIIDNQRSIAVELRMLNDKCDIIIEQTKKDAELSTKSNELLEQAVKNTEISKYNTERIKKELEYQTFIELWDIKGGHIGLF